MIVPAFTPVDIRVDTVQAWALQFEEGPRLYPSKTRWSTLVHDRN